jgi:alkylated DNA repair dioxygenase AlkB
MYDKIVAVPRLVAGAPGSRLGFGFEEGEVERRKSRAGRLEIEEAQNHLARMSAHLSVRYGRALDQVTLAYYRDGRDSVAFHGDKMGALRRDTVVAIVSLGAPRQFLLRPAPDPGNLGNPRLSTHRFRFGGGDLLVMGGTCQETWEHGVPKMAQAGPRLAIMFREKVPESRPAAPKPRSAEPLRPRARRIAG